METDKKDRINEKKTQIGNRNQRKLKKYSHNFDEMFVFFLKSYRKGILTFCGSAVNVSYITRDELGHTDGKYSFRKFENGQFKWKEFNSCHPNVLKGVNTGKKSWGLWVKQWSEGIVEWSFTKEEIVKEFTDKGITIPTALMKEFDNAIIKCREDGYDKQLEMLRLMKS